MAVNLSTNRLALLTAYQDVIDDSSSTDWALYTYEGLGNDLTLASSGDGGLPEITVTFDNAKVMYGFCSLKEPSAALPRYILINWVGEDVPDARKCACASHVATIAEFFQGVNVIVNASTMDDIDPSAIGQRLTNGTTVVASPVLGRLKTREEEGGEHVGTVYEKTNAEIEMKKINREEFWEKAKREEEMRKEEDRKKVAEERQRFEEERMELERKEQEDRERRYRERERQIEEHRKKMQDEEEAKEKTRNQPSVVAEPSYEDPNQEKRESEVEEAKAIIAQRSGNPREFFKLKEKAVSISLDTSPLTVHRPGRLDSPFLKQQTSPSAPSSHPGTPRGVSPLRTPPHGRTQPRAPAGRCCPCNFACSLSIFVLFHWSPLDGEDANAGGVERSMAAVTPIPKIVTTPIQEDLDDECSNNWDSCPKPSSPVPVPAPVPVQDSSSSKPVQSVAPQTRDSSSFSLSHGDDDIFSSGFRTVNLWDSASASSPASKSSQQVDLMSDSAEPRPVDPAMPRPQPLLSFDEFADGGSFCSGSVADDDPSSLVDMTGSHPMTLSYQHALQHAAGRDSANQELEDGLLTNGDRLLKEGTQASEGYFSQSQEEDDCSGKPTPVFYNKPPEIDITCWDTDPVVDDDD
ncbi:drebrin [Aplochiton taeniatus]